MKMRVVPSQSTVGCRPTLLLLVLGLLASLVASSLGGASQIEEARLPPKVFLDRVISIAKHGDLWDSQFVAKQLNIQFTTVVDKPEKGMEGFLFKPNIDGQWPDFLSKDLTYGILKIPGMAARGRLNFRIDAEKKCVQITDVPAELQAKAQKNVPTISHRGEKISRETNDYGWEYRFAGMNSIRLLLTFRWTKCLQEVSLIQNVE